MTEPQGQGAAPAGRGRRGGPPAWIALAAIASLVLGAGIVVAQLAGGGSTGGAALATMAPAGEPAQLTRDQVRAALEAASFQVRDPQTPYRPGESPGLVDAPRQLLQVVLPSDPDGGYVVIYELPDNNAADRAGRDFAAYLASGTGAIQYPRDAQFVIRRIGSTLVFFPWSAEANPDPRVAELAAALESLGEPVRT